MKKYRFAGHQRNKNGFTLVEMMIVVVIVGIIATLSIVSIVNAFISSNEATAQASLNTVRAAMVKYRISNSVYAPSLAALGQGTPPYIDPLLASGARQGYNFAMSNSTPNTFTVTATPQQVNVTGKRTFTVTESGDITSS